VVAGALMPRVGAPILDALMPSIDAGAGPWGLEVVIQRGDETSSAQGPLSIVPARSRLREYWPHVLLPPAVTLVFVLHQFLVEPERASA